MYIANEARSLILSETALKDLGVIPENFPCAGMFSPIRESPTQQNVQEACKTTADVSSAVPAEAEIPVWPKNKCGCLLRTEVPPLPTKIPYEDPESHREELSKWILDYYAASAFNTCPHQVFPTLTGPEMIIKIKEGAEPVACHSPIPVPHHWKRKVKAEIDKNCRMGVMAPVPSGVPTPWCSRLLSTPKKNGDPRLVVDLQPLNAVSLRETHHTPSPWNLVCAIPKGVKKTILDAKDGYHSIPLAPESRALTTYISEWGRYWYLRAPQGWTGSGDAYTVRVDGITVEVLEKVRCIDDSCLWKVLIRDNFWHTVTYIDLCGRNGVTFNPSKFVFAADVVEFAGFTVTMDSIKPTLKMTEAIREFPTPTSITGVRSWFGLVNQVSYSFAQSEVMFPFRELLQQKKKFYWDETLTTLFEKSKEEIIAKVEHGVRIFEVNRCTCIATDWSKTGVGFLLLQKHCDCEDTSKAPCCGPSHWQLIFAGSRFLKDPEGRYAPIEGEALAVVYALEQTRMFVIGCPNLIIATDHKPLVPILNGKRLDLIKNPRLLKLKERTLMYRFLAQHIPGPLNFAADATSRNPPDSDSAEVKSLLVSIASLEAGVHQEEGESIDTALVNAISALDDDVVSWNRVKEAASKDDSCMYICDAIADGFSQRKTDAPECLRPYYKLKDELYSLDGVPFLNGRMYIPKSLRREILSILHSAHQGPAGMKAAARHRFWWLGMDSDINQVRAQCKDCNEGAPSNTKEPLLTSPDPEYPWQQTVMDYFDLAGINYLVVADRFTGWPEIFRQNGKAMTLIRTCRNLFAQFGVPEEVSSDGGPPFDSFEWKKFLVQWDVGTRRSSANYPQSNGRAELAVKSCKRMLRNNTDTNGNLDTAKVTKALLQYRNTPIPGLGMSPAYMLFGRQLRDALPSQPNTSALQGRPGDVWSDIRHRREIVSAKKRVDSADYYNEHKRPLKPLVVRDSVSIQNMSGSHPLRWDRTGVIVERLENRQYLVKTDGSGRVLLRTRAHLRKIDPSTRNSPDQEPAPVDAPSVHPPQEDALHIPGQLADGSRVVHPTESTNLPETVDPPATGPETPPPPTTEPPAVEAAPPRRSTRVRRPTKVLTPCMQGQYHSEVPRT